MYLDYWLYEQGPGSQKYKKINRYLILMHPMFSHDF